MNAIDFNKLFEQEGKLVIYQNSFPVEFFTAETRFLADLAPDDVILEFVGRGEDGGAPLEFGFTKRAWLEAEIDLGNPAVLVIEDVHGDTVNLEFECSIKINLRDFREKIEQDIL